MAVSASAARRPLRRPADGSRAGGSAPGSLGLERRVFRLSAIPGAFVKTALRVGWRASADRGGAARGANPGVPGGGAWRGDLIPPGFRGLGVMWPPGVRCTAERGDAAQLRRGPRCSRAGELGRGRGRGPRQLGLRPGAIRRRGVVPGISGRAPLSGPMVQGLGVWPIAGSRQTGRWGQGRGSTVAPCFPTPRQAQRSPPERPLGGPGGAQGLVLRRLAWGFGRAFESCPIRQSYRTFSTHDKPGGFRATQRDKAPRKNSSYPGDSRRSRPPRRTACARSGAPFGAVSAGSPHKAPLNENPGAPSLSTTGADPSLGAGARKGGGGRAAVCRRGRARFARRIFARRSARRRGLALTAGAAERRGLRQNPAPQHRRRRAA